MIKLTEMKKMIKKDFNEKHIYNLERCTITIRHNTYGIIDTYLQIATKEYCINTTSVLNENCRKDVKKVEEARKYVKKVVKSFVEVEEIDVKVVEILEDGEELVEKFEVGKCL
jgi:predicted nucleic acid-binding protein